MTNIHFNNGSAAPETVDPRHRRTVPQLVVTDLDGTLWDESVRCHPATLDALAQLAERRIPVLAATGRRASTTTSGLSENGLCLPAVMLNGALGVDFPVEREFHQRSFTTTQANAALSVFDGLGLAPAVYLADGRIAVGANITSSEVHRNEMGEDFLAMQADDATERFDILSFSFFGQSQQAMDAAVDGLVSTRVEDQNGILAPCANYSLYADPLYGNWSLTIQPPGISKREGIAAYLEYANLAPERILAIGDSGNDLEMLKAADVAFSLEDADVQAKAIADAIFPPSHRGGWARVLDYLE